MQASLYSTNFSGRALSMRNKKSLCDYSARDAVTCVSSGIGLHVICFGVNDDCCSAIAKHGMVVISKISVHVHDGGLQFAIFTYSNVLHVSSVVAFGIFCAVMFGVGVEVA